MGRKAASLILKILSSFPEDKSLFNEKTILEPELIVRKSTAPVKRGDPG